MRLCNLRLTAKLLCSFALIIALLIGVSVTGLIQLARVNAHTDEIGDRWLTSIYSIEEMRLAVSAYRRHQYNHLTATDHAGMAKCEERMAKDLADLAAAQKLRAPLAQSAQEQAAYAVFLGDWQAYLDLAQRWLPLSQAGKKEEARAAFASGPMYDTFQKCDAGLKGIADLDNQGADQAQEQAHAIGSHAFTLISLITGLATVGGLVLAVVIARSIVRPIRAMAAGLRRLAVGDLTAHVAIAARDEVGEMAAAFNASLDSLQQVMTEIRSAADQTAASGEELSASAQNISSGAQSQASSVEEISASVQELSRSIDQVATNTNAANTVALSTSQSAEQGSQTVGRSIEGMKAINESSHQIAKIIGVINQIANQTNLLALNAAIEAASAGEHGLGFAVVADEVRKLAERSSTAAQEIAQLIDESGRRVNEGAALSQEVGRSLQAILDGTGRTTAGMGGIATGAEAQARTAKEVASSVEGISAITEENSASAEEMAASAEELSAQAQRLQELVARFRLADQGGAALSASATSAAPAAAERAAPAAKPAKAAATPARSAAKAAAEPARSARRRTVVTDGDAGGDPERVGKALYHE